MSCIKGKKKTSQAIVLLVEMLAFSTQVTGWVFLVWAPLINVWVQLTLVRPGDTLPTIFALTSIAFGCFLLLFARGLYRKSRSYLLLVAFVNGIASIGLIFAMANRDSDLQIWKVLPPFLVNAFIFSIAIAGLAKRKAIGN